MSIRVIIIEMNNSDVSSRLVTSLKTIVCSHNDCYSLTSLDSYLRQKSAVNTVKNNIFYFYKGKLLSEHVDFMAITEPICCYSIHRVTDRGYNESPYYSYSSESYNNFNRIVDNLLGRISNESQASNSSISRANGYHVAQISLDEQDEVEDLVNDEDDTDNDTDDDNRENNDIQQSHTSFEDQKEEHEEKESEDISESESQPDNNQSSLLNRLNSVGEIVIDIRPEDFGDENWFMNSVHRALNAMNQSQSALSLSELSVSESSNNISIVGVGLGLSALNQQQNHQIEAYNNPPINHNNGYNDLTDMLYSMGFTGDRDILDAVQIADGNIDIAINYLIGLQ